MMIANHEAQKIADVLIGLSDPTRIHILTLLFDGPRNVGYLAKAIGVPMVNASHHLKVMRQAGLLTFTKQGRLVIYEINPALYSGFQRETGEEHFTLGAWALAVRRSG